MSWCLFILGVAIFFGLETQGAVATCVVYGSATILCVVATLLNCGVIHP